MLATSESESLSSKKTSDLFQTAKTASAVDPDEVSPTVFKLRVRSLLKIMIVLVSEFFVTGISLAPKKSLTHPIPKHKLGHLTKQFRLTVIVCTKVKLTGRAVFSRLCSFLVIPNDPFPFAHKPKGCTMDELASLCHFVSKNLNSSLKSVRRIFLDHPLAFDSILRRFFS